MAFDPKFWAATFVSELMVGDQQIPLERVVARHIGALGELRRLGMTWRGIVTLLVRAGARRADGRLISADQIRVSYARLTSGNAATSPKRRRSARRPRPVLASVEAPSLIASPPPSEDEQPGGRNPQSLDEDKEISDSELQSALLRLGKLTPKDNSK